MEDFKFRNVWCVLGLPFDAINMESAVRNVHEAARQGTSFFISTPNLHFVINSHKDIAFRDSVINSDMIVTDGKPLVWVAQLLNIPIPERVAGADLVDALVKNKDGHEPLKVFFFGGKDGIAKQACDRLNSLNKGLKCVGYLNPGYGSLEDMSMPEVLDEINRSGADFIIVALGAKKGQAWIEHNRHRLDPPIISHLGACINFVAGHVERSPKLLQRLGLEWLWRIKEEPSLWSRYWNDGLSLTYLTITRIIPYSFLIKKVESKKSSDKPTIKTVFKDEFAVIHIDGHAGVNNIAEFEVLIRNVVKEKSNIRVVISCESYIDSAFIAMLVRVKKYLSENDGVIHVESDSRLIKRILYYNCCEYLLDK